MYQFIDVSGLGNSGKSVVVDFLREFDNTYVPHVLFEFDIFRRSGGIFNLYFHMCENWNLIRSNQAVLDYKNFSRKIGGCSKKHRIYSLLTSSGTEFDAYFNNNFHSLSNKYIDSFIVSKYRTFWPYYLDTDHWWIRFFKKFKIRYFKNSPPLSDVFLTDGSFFREKTTSFISSLYSSIVGPSVSHIVMNNSFDATTPEYGQKVLNNARSIIVIRDPRDVYVSALGRNKISTANLSLLPPENNAVNKSFAGADDIDAFIIRQKLMFKNLYRGTHANVLVLRFEDVVEKYDLVANQIISFLDLDPKNHVKRKMYLDPQKSIKNIDLYKRYSNQNEIRYIEEQLRDSVKEYSL